MILKTLSKCIMELTFVSWFVAFVFSLAVRFIYLFSKVECRGIEKLQSYVKTGKPVVIVFWHGRSFFLSNFWRKQLKLSSYPIYGIFSDHRDGKLIGRLFRCLGVKNIMLSVQSKKQSSAVARRCLSLLKSGSSIGFTPDGPIGPRMTFVSDSPMLFAKMTGAPIVPMYVSSDRPKLLNSWDKYMIVKPFRKTVVEVDDMVFVDKRMSDKDFKVLKDKLVVRMVEKSLKLDKEMGMPVIKPGEVSKKRKVSKVKVKKK